MEAPNRSKPRILLIDIETFPMLFYAWEPWEASALRIVEDTAICSFSAKWLGGQHTTKALCDYPGYKAGSRDDRRLLKDLWTLLDEADMVGAHNGDRFDMKKITFRFMVHGMKPPSPFQTIDTLKEVRRVASFDSHKLNELCRVLKIGQKVRTGGKDLWFDCLEGNLKAWARMKRYNAHDVRLLDGLYRFLLPYMKRHPNVTLFNARALCPRCGGRKIQRRGEVRLQTRSYWSFQCRACMGWLRSTDSTGHALTVAA